MEVLAPGVAGLLADLMLVVHVGIVLFVVLGQLLIILGGYRRWAWVRHYGLRVTHVVLILVIVVQAWLGRLCPLTIWEQALRHHAGQSSYGGSFIEHWLSRLIFFEAPWWAFVAAYSVFAVVVVLSWVWVPPRRKVPAA